jgi:hypothetical protein
MYLVGFSPAACSFGCLSDFGLGAEFTMGSTTIGVCYIRDDIRYDIRYVTTIGGMLY